jgi:ribosomal protein S17E
MGRIKGALIKRTARSMLKEENNFNDNFNKNKKLIGNTMPSKSLRNKIAGYIARINADEKKRTVSSKIETTQ